jgi:hypothetical protein
VVVNLFGLVADTAKQRSYYEINLLFQKKLPARQFKGTVIDANSEEAIREQQLGGH